jgi:hypothetical protein
MSPRESAHKRCGVVSGDQRGGGMGDSDLLARHSSLAPALQPDCDSQLPRFPSPVFLVKVGAHGDAPGRLASRPYEPRMAIVRGRARQTPSPWLRALFRRRLGVQ